VTGLELDKLYKEESLSSDHDLIEPFFYGIGISPPGIAEFDISDIDNVIVNKVYKMSG
jgi:hypothetical protein